jgi:hypothetical protein
MKFRYNVPMSKHTPGPWNVFGSETVRGSIPQIHVGTEERLTAKIPVFGQESAEANARLIAAAPELLDGLKQAVDHLKLKYEPTPLDGEAALIRKLESLINKTGGS